MFLNIVLALIGLVILWDFMNKKRRNEIFAEGKISGPAAYPLFGCFVVALKFRAENMVHLIGELFQEFGKTFRFWVFAEAQIFTKDIAFFESILSSTTVLKKGDFYRFVKPFLNDGLLLSEKQKWHSRRKIFTTAFHFNVLETYVNIFDQQSAVLVETLRPLADSKTVIDMTQKICLAALDVITEAAMGVKVNAQANSNFPYVKALKQVVYIQPNRMFNPQKTFDFIYKILFRNEYLQLKEDIQIMQNFTISVIEKRRAALEASLVDGTYKPLSSGNAEIGSRSQMAFLDILLRSQINGKPLTNDEIREEVDTFMFEGDDTTTSCVSHALYLLARHPEVQKKVVQEIHSVIGEDKNSPITIKHLTDLKYLECVIKETLRLYPAVPAIGRKLDKDMKINGVTIPANTSIYLVLFWAHRDPDNFPDPDNFIPERFLNDQKETNDKAFSYVPFSAGPRNCIGQKFAMLEVKTLLSKMLRHYEILPLGADLYTMMNFILRSSTGLNVGLRPRPI